VSRIQTRALCPCGAATGPTVPALVPKKARAERRARSTLERAVWTDARLRFNGTAAGGCVDKLSLSTAEITQIWRPLFYWEGAKRIALPDPANDGKGELLFVYPDGSVWWSRQVIFTFKCVVGTNLARMPFDTQRCEYVMGMYTYDAADIRLRWRSGEVALDNWQGACLSEWYATELTQTDVLQTYATTNFSYARAEIAFTRAPGSLLNAYFVPGMIFVLLSNLGF
jgi:hypothetical protein